MTFRRLTLQALLSFLLVGCGGGDEVETVVIEAQNFTQRVTAEGVLQAAQVTPLAVPSQVRRSVRLAWLLEDGHPLEEGDVVARFDPYEMQEALERAQRDLETAQLSVKKERIEGEGQVLTYRTDEELARLELEHAERYRKEDSEVFSRQEIVQDAIDEELARTRSEHAAESRETQKTLNDTELDILGIRRRQAEKEIQRTEEGLSALEVRAPHAGILTLHRDWQGNPPEVGASMWRGQKIGEIPDLGEMEAEVYVLEADAGGLEVGKTAEVIIESRPGQPIAATIRRVDAVAKTRVRGSPVQYFGVTLALEHTNPDFMKPGQRVRATLWLEELEEALVVPRQAVVREEGANRVYVWTGGAAEAREVELGPATPGLVVVNGGLEEGEAVVLDPAFLGAGSSEEDSADAEVGG